MEEFHTFNIRQIAETLTWHYRYIQASYRKTYAIQAIQDTAVFLGVPLLFFSGGSSSQSPTPGKDTVSFPSAEPDLAFACDLRGKEIEKEIRSVSSLASPPGSCQTSISEALRPGRPRST